MAEQVLIGAEQMADLDRTLAPLAGPGPVVDLLFDNHWNDDSAAPGILSAALMGTLAERELLIDVVDEEASEKLLQFGVASALWRRPAQLTSFTDKAHALNHSALGAVWTIGDIAAGQALFADSPTPSSAFGPTHATFVNPHLSSGDDGYPDVLYLVGRWLFNRFERFGESGEQMVGAVEKILGELVSNVHEHAGSVEHPRIDSLVRIGIDAEAIRCTVSDNGIGICESLRPKLDEDHLEHPATSQELLNGLLAGELRRWHHGRGVGLGRVLQIARRRAGKVNVATRTNRSVVESAVPTTSVADLDLQGTVVDVVLPLPSA